MRNAVLLVILCLLMGIAVLIGNSRLSSGTARETDEVAVTVPSIGNVQVLNSCGIDGIANKTADFLRAHGFDVKNIGNATTWGMPAFSWNYPFTIVVSRSKDMKNAYRAAKILKTDKVIMLRDDESPYDLVVFAGSDIQKVIK